MPSRTKISERCLVILVVALLGYHAVHLKSVVAMVEQVVLPQGVPAKPVLPVDVALSSHAVFCNNNNQISNK